MSARKKVLIAITTGCLLPSIGTLALNANSAQEDTSFTSLSQDAIARELGWVASTENNCGGYYLEEPFVYPVTVDKTNLVEITSNQTLFSQRSTSILEGKVTVTREGQQMTSNKAYLYRDPTTGKLSSVEMIGDVHLREPNTLVVGKRGRYNFDTKMKSLIDILYRTSLNGRSISGAASVPAAQTKKERKITTLTAWGTANDFSQTEPQIYELTSASFSTCPPANPAWRLKAKHIVLNKETGRGYATHARILVKNVPVFYTPYINFPIDNRRKSGFLWPTFGTHNTWGPYFLAPFYWNMAPNYDMTITPGLLTKRGLQLTDNYRYLTPYNTGNLNISVLPGDSYFADFQTASKEKYGNSTDPATQAELNRLLNSSTTRKGLEWRDNAQYNEHWSSHVDFNYAGDDYYLQDFGSSLNQITENQLLQEGDLNYKGQNWNFTGRLQAYQTLHPIVENQAPTQNQYRRLPQLILNGDYPDQPYGLEYFINNEVTNFTFLKTPGSNTESPVGDRLNTQPGVSLPVYTPYFYINPRAQVALTHYDLHETGNTSTPNTIDRDVPIFDVATGATFDRNFAIFSHGYQQTLEPQVYYTYIPYRNQSDIPVFDTNVNTLVYDQIFNYNRFSGIDRIGDANQVGVGVTTRLIDQDSGLEKVRLGVGDIVYFADRRVTLCNSNTECTDYPDNPNNHYRLSPVSGNLNVNLIPNWGLGSNALWNPVTKQLDNSSIELHYQTDNLHIFNAGYSFARNGDPFSGINTNTAENNLKLTDISFTWPMMPDVSAVGRWSHDWNTNHFQNLLYGLQYDTCCWAVRLVGGRTFVGLDPANNSTLKYNSEFYVQFALKGLGNVGSDPSGLLRSINGYNTQFGQEL